MEVDQIVSSVRPGFKVYLLLIAIFVLVWFGFVAIFYTKGQEGVNYRDIKPFVGFRCFVHYRCCSHSFLVCIGGSMH